MKAAPLVLSLVVLGALAQAKEARTYFTDAKVQGALAKIEQHEWARNERDTAKAACEWLIEMTDEELWDFVPPPQQARALNVSFGAGCPVHGAEVFRKGGHYPWIMSRDRPFKVKCPVGGEEYPSNDFEGWNLEGQQGTPESGPGFVDKGIGWTDEKGTRYWFVAHYIFWQRWHRDIFPAMRELPKAYLLTQDPIYAHKCAVLLARIAGYYEQYDYRSQAYHNGKWVAGINGRIMDYIWETGVISKFAEAYDAVFPSFAQDADLVAFLQSKGITDPPRHIETKMLHVMASDIMRGFIRGNYGMHQKALATVAIVLGNDDPATGPTTEQMLDWILSGPGDVNYTLWNGYYRDGHGGESSPGYSSGWCLNFYEMAELLEQLGVDLWSNPKVKKMADIGPELTVAGEFTPSIGDSGSILGSKRVAWSSALQGRAFRKYGDARYAKIMALLETRTESLWTDSVDDRIAAIVAKEGTDLGLRTRNLGGYGLAVLESGKAPHKRGVSMYYGHAGGGHGHRDRLTIEMFSHGKPMLTDMGYPAHWLAKNAYWTSNTTSHYAVLVDQSGQKTMYPGHLNTLAGAPGVQLMDAGAEDVAYPGKTSVYRRTTALIDISETDCYMLDIFRAQGGEQHDWSFHGPGFPEFTVAGARPGPAQTKGTLAGENVAFGQRPSHSEIEGGITVDLRKAEGLVSDDRSYAERSADGWTAYSTTAVLTRKHGAALHCITPSIPAGSAKVFLYAHNYETGANEVDITLAGVTKTFRWEGTGETGYKWLSQVFELPTATTQVTVAERSREQSYALIDGLVISREMDREEPRLADLSMSGFQYLRNIRRMKPEGSWSATWREPDEDLALTMTMPAGCCQQVILADAEPELKPGHPDTLQYVFGRNAVEPQALPEAGLASTFIAVIEPHKGPAKVDGVLRLTQDAPVEWAEGLQINRGPQTELVHSSTDPVAPCVWQGGKIPLKVAGEFAVVTLDELGVKRACLVNGTLLQCGDLTMEPEPSMVGTVTHVDHEANAITLDVSLSAVDAYTDRVVISGNELHQTSYTVRRATVRQGNTTLQFGDVLFLVGMGNVTELDDVEHTVATDTQLTGYGRVDGGRHAGRWLYNEDKTRGYRIASFRAGKFTLEGLDGELAQIYADADGDGRRRFWISDIGPGDTCRIPNITQIQRLRPGLYTTQMTTQVAVGLPDHGRAPTGTDEQ